MGEITKVPSFILGYFQLVGKSTPDWQNMKRFFLSCPASRAGQHLIQLRCHSAREPSLGSSELWSRGGRVFVRSPLLLYAAALGNQDVLQRASLSLQLAWRAGDDARVALGESLLSL